MVTAFSHETHVDQIKEIVEDLKQERQRSAFLENYHRVEQQKHFIANCKATLLADALETILDQTSEETFKKKPLFRVARMLWANWKLMNESPKDTWRS